MHGSSATSCENEYFKQAMLTVSQLLKFNTFIRTRKDSLSSYHSTQREPLLPVYISLMINNETQDRVLIKKLSQLGLCISKHRVSQLSISMGNTVIKANERDGMVLPMSLKLGVFSTASVDNIDIEIQSSLSTSLHGTAASINQHPGEHNQGQPTEKIMLNQNVLKLRPLPGWYTEIKPFHLRCVYLTLQQTNYIKARRRYCVNRRRKMVAGYKFIILGCVSLIITTHSTHSLLPRYFSYAANTTRRR